MSELRIINGFNNEIKDLLGDLAERFEVVKGDTRLTWDAGNEEDVDTARQSFERLTKKGYSAFSVGKEGEKKGRIREFDPEAEKVILAAPTRGG